MKEKLEQILREQKWGQQSATIVQTENSKMIQAHIDNQWNIHVKYDSSLESLDSLLAKNKNPVLGLFQRQKDELGDLFEGKDNVSNMLYFIIGHEIGHWKNCPFDWDHYEDIISGVSKGLKDIGATTEEIKRHSPRITNYFADIIDNVMNMYRDPDKEQYQDGFLAFNAKEGKLSNGFPKDFATFIDVTCKLGMDTQPRKNFAQLFTQEHISPYTSEILNILITDKEIAKKTKKEELSLQEKIKVYHQLGNNKLWYFKAYDFTKIIGKLLLEEQRKKQTQDYQNSLPGEHNHADELEEKTPELVNRSIAKGRIPLYADDFLLLDSLYKSRAKKLIMNANDEIRQKLVIAHLNRTEMNQNSVLSNVDWQNPELGVDEFGNEELILYEKIHPLTFKSGGSIDERTIPDLLLVLDCSPSMTSGYNPKAGTGAYDTLLRSVYSMFNTLDDNDQIQNMNFGAILFEGMPNYFSGWQSFYEMKKLKEVLFKPSNYVTGGSTLLDKSKLIQATDEAKSNFWTIFVSDGEVDNINDATPGIEYLANHSRQISLINISEGPTKLSHVISGLGGDVINVANPQELPNTLLGRTKEIYG